MKFVSLWTGRLTAVCIAAAIAGCQTYGESAALGGLIGAAAGTIIGHQSDSELEGAAIGAAVGAAAGAIAKDQQVRREERREADYEARRSTPPPPPQPPQDAETLALENITVMPSVVHRGNIVEVSIQYAVYNAGDGIRIRETRALFKDGREVETFASNLIYRGNGSWVSPQQFRIAHDLGPGVYEIVQTIESRNAQISGRRTLRVE